ncbi:MAG: glycosyltransferase [Ignavibacteria bacterium]
MGRIKVLEVIDGGFLGGGQTNILSIIRNIDRNKFDVHVAAMGGGKFENEVNKCDIPFYAVELPKVLRHRFLKKLGEIQNRERFEIVHSHGGVGGFYGRLLRKHDGNIKSVHTIHGIHYLNSDNVLIRNVSKSIEQYLVQFTDRTVCENQTDFKTAIENKIADENKTVVINNGVNIFKFANLKKNLDLIKRFGLDEKNFIVGNVSRFDVQKNQSLIIQASYYLIKKFPEMRFILAGGGKLLKKMKDYAMDSNLENYVLFAGERENIEDYYSIFDIIVLPSLWEGMSIVLLESMASRLPIICSNIPCNLEVIKNNYSALTVNPHEADDLITKISILYNNKELREKLVQNALIEVTQYDEGEMTRKIEAVYQEAV